MPELPEVETIARDVRPHLAGARIVAARVFRRDVLRRVSRPAFERALRGRRIVSVGRRAKHLVIELEDGHRLVIQPRMTGSLLVGTDAGGWEGGSARARANERGRYDVLHLLLDSGTLVRYRDVRRLGAVFLLNPSQWAKYTAAIGPEPLEPEFTAGRFHAILRNGRLAVKKAIMDQRRLAGVGNIYANEALWMAGIDPSREARRITVDEAARLHAAIIEVLGRAIEGRGTTVRDYRTGTGGPGSFQGRLAVYERAGEPCPRCRRRIAMTHAVDARSSYFCPGCQR